MGKGRRWRWKGRGGGQWRPWTGRWATRTSACGEVEGMGVVNARWRPWRARQGHGGEASGGQKRGCGREAGDGQRRRHNGRRPRRFPLRSPSPTTSQWQIPATPPCAPTSPSPSPRRPHADRPPSRAAVRAAAHRSSSRRTAPVRCHPSTARSSAAVHAFCHGFVQSYILYFKVITMLFF